MVLILSQNSCRTICYNRAMDLNTLKRQWLEYVEIEKGRSLKTVANYERYLDRFLGFTQVKRPQDIDDETVRKYRLWLNRQRGTEDDKRSVYTCFRKSGNTQHFFSRTKTGRVFIMLIAISPNFGRINSANPIRQKLALGNYTGFNLKFFRFTRI